MTDTPLMRHFPTDDSLEAADRALDQIEAAIDTLIQLTGCSNEAISALLRFAQSGFDSHAQHRLLTRQRRLLEGLFHQQGGPADA